MVGNHVPRSKQLIMQEGKPYFRVPLSLQANHVHSYVIIDAGVQDDEVVQVKRLNELQES